MKTRSTLLGVALLAVVAGASKPIFDEVICMPEGMTATAVTVCGELDDATGASLVGGAAIIVEQQTSDGLASSAADVVAGVNGYVSDDFELVSFDGSKPVSISIWSGAAEGQRFSTESIFVDANAGAAAFLDAIPIREAGCYKVSVDDLKVALPPSIGDVTVTGVAPSDLAIHVENPAFGRSPFDSLKSIAGTLTQGQSSFDLFSWNGQSSWRISLIAPDGTLWARGMLRRDSTLTLDVGGKGTVSGDVDTSAYPDGQFVLARETSKPFPSSTAGRMFMMTTVSQSRLENDEYQIDALDAGEYSVELWAYANSAGPVATEIVTILPSQTSTIDFD